MHRVRKVARLLYDTFAHILPPSVDERLAAQVTEATVKMEQIHKGARAVIVCMRIDEPCVRALMHTLKFHGNVASANHIGVLLAPHIESLCRRQSIDMIVPVPLSATRERQRGFNQVTYACEHIAQHAPTLQSLISPGVLKRTRDTAPQTNLGRTARISNMHDAFRCTRTVAGLHILLIDDVVTTGATLSAARHALQEAGAASVTLVAFAGR